MGFLRLTLTKIVENSVEIFLIWPLNILRGGQSPSESFSFPSTLFENWPNLLPFLSINFWKPDVRSFKCFPEPLAYAYGTLASRAPSRVNEVNADTPTYYFISLRKYLWSYERPNFPKNFFCEQTPPICLKVSWAPS